MKRNGSVLLVILFNVLCGTGCISISRSDAYGIREIESPSGEKLYFRREVRGRNYDSLSLSSNPSACATPDPNNSLIFVGMDPLPLFYRFEGQELHIYSASTVSEPKNPSLNTRIVVHPLSNPEFIRMEKDYQTPSLEILEVPVSDKLSCIF